jgi:putative toxin-antitoxin system antitoxin component (TIGR02293 family)
MSIDSLIITMTQSLSQYCQDYSSVLKLSNKYHLEREQIRSILGISESTQFRYEKSNPVLKPNLCDRWARFVKIVELASDLFEDEQETQRWLSTPKQALNARTPLELLTTDSGVRQVEQILLQASYGIF